MNGLVLPLLCKTTRNKDYNHCVEQAIMVVVGVMLLQCNVELI